MPNIQDYKFSYNRVSQIDWAVKVITPDNVTFSTQIRCGPNEPQKEQVWQAFVEPANKGHWIIDLEEIKPAPPQPEPDIKIQFIPKEEVKQDNTLIYES